MLTLWAPSSLKPHLPRIWGLNNALQLEIYSFLIGLNIFSESKVISLFLYLKELLKPSVFQVIKKSLHYMYSMHQNEFLDEIPQVTGAALWSDVSSNMSICTQSGIQLFTQLKTVTILSESNRFDRGDLEYPILKTLLQLYKNYVMAMFQEVLVNI